MNEPATRGVWDREDVQSRFLDLISRGYQEVEAIHMLNESNVAAGCEDRVTVTQYMNYKRRRPEFQRALAAVMESRVADLDRSMLQIAVEAEDYRPKMQYLEYNERKIARLHRQTQQQEQHDDEMFLAAGTVQDEVQMAQVAARKRQAKEVLEVEEITGEIEQGDG